MLLGSGTQRAASEVDPSGDQLMGGSESRRNRAADSRCVARQLVMGSSDPHGLQLDDDRAPSCAKRPAFAIATHLPAEAQELAIRAVAFKKQRGRLPQLTADDAWERRMAEGARAFVRYKDEGKYD